MLAIGNEEMKDAETLGKLVKCPICPGNHRVKTSYSEVRNSKGKWERDGGNIQSYKCRGKHYMCGIGGQSIMNILEERKK